MRLPNSARRCDRISTPLIRHSRTANNLYNGPQASPPIVTASGAGALDDSRQVVRDLHRFEPTGARNLARHLDERHRQEQLTMVAHQAAGLGGDLLELQNDVSLDILAHHPVGQRQRSFEKRRQRERTVVRRDQQVIRSRDLLDQLELPSDAHRRCAGVERPT